ncbi:MAG: hypothetical protein OSB09_01380 [Planctomycetota bacterium]|nr:hypothetical protein [Planctomycetota bacterium]
MKRIERAYWAIGCWLVLALIGYGLQPLVNRSGSADLHRQLLEQALQRSLISEAEEQSILDRQQLLDRYLAANFAGSLYQMVPARLSPHLDPHPRRSVARLDRGTETGLLAGMGVIGAAGVIGKITSSGPGWSLVQLADDPAFVIPFIDEVGRSAIYAGGPNLGRGHPRLRIDPVELLDGMVLRTHGGGGTFPEGLVVGVVSEVRFPFRNSVILLTSTLHHGQEVLVLTPLTKVKTR